jgi:hypothetical protein
VLLRLHFIGHGRIADARQSVTSTAGPVLAQCSLIPAPTRPPLKPRDAAEPQHLADDRFVEETFENGQS